MKRSQMTLIAVAVLGGIAASIVIYQRGQSALARNEIELAQHRARMEELVADQRRLSNAIASAGVVRSNNAVAELAQLRNEASQLREEIKQLSSTGAPPATPAPPRKEGAPAPGTPEYFKQLHLTAGTRNRDAMALDYALQLYANDHKGAMPRNVADLKDHLGQAPHPLSGTNEFDIVFSGTTEDLSKVPLSAVALIRERGSWIAPSGKAARVYGMADGSARVVESDDDFRTFEKEHVIQPAGGGR